MSMRESIISRVPLNGYMDACLAARIEDGIISLAQGNCEKDGMPNAWGGISFSRHHLSALNDWLEVHTRTWADELRQEFPGLMDGETDVNGADLVDWLTHNMPRGAHA